MTTITTIAQPFSDEQLERANEEWGCNCGPSALAFALQLPLEAARHAIPEFESKRYTSPTMMRAALAFLNRTIVVISPPRFKPGTPVDVVKMFPPRERELALVRVQWCGPWTEKGANPKWAYRYTHWIATWQERGVDLVYDCNGGIQGGAHWCDVTAPMLANCAERASGEWFPTTIWRLPAPGGER